MPQVRYTDPGSVTSTATVELIERKEEPPQTWCDNVLLFIFILTLVAVISVTLLWVLHTESNT